MAAQAVRKNKILNEYRKGCENKPIESYFEEVEAIAETGGLEHSLSPIRPKLENINHVYDILMNSFKEPLEICVTVNETLLSNYNNTSITDMLHKAIAPFFKKAGKAIILIGEHSNVGRWHYHGMFEGLSNDAKAKLKRVCRKTCGITTIRAITYEKSYIDYIVKSYTRTKEGLNFNPEEFNPDEQLYLVGLRK